MKRAFLFPGQGAQYPGMGGDFVDQFATARQTLEEADDILGRKLSGIILNGPESLLTETRNSQTGIYVVSVAILRVVNEQFPDLLPDVCAGLSLGEYTAATASGYLDFQEGLPLVQNRGLFMNDACVATEGTMAVVLGLSAEDVQKIIKDVNLPGDLWAANFNCPGQVVISGTSRGIKAGAEAARERGAKRVLPLQVHGAFHSGLMEPARERLAPHVEEVHLQANHAALVMNAPGRKVENEAEIKRYLTEQVTSPVRWEMGIREMESMGVGHYIEMGPGKTLAGFNKRIGVVGTTVSIEKVEDLEKLENTVH